MRVLTVCGSLGPTSANRAALDVAVRHLGPLVDSIGDATSLEPLPAFRPDKVDTPPDSIAALRSQIELADLIILAAPEYAGGVAGSTKNMLDWMVGSGSLYQRAVAVMSVGTTGGRHAIDQLVRTLTWQGAFVVSTCGVAGPKTKSDADGQFTDPATITSIEQWATTALDATLLPEESLTRHVADIASRHGIEPGRID